MVFPLPPCVSRRLGWARGSSLTWLVTLTLSLVLTLVLGLALVLTGADLWGQLGASRATLDSSVDGDRCRERDVLRLRVRSK